MKAGCEPGTEQRCEAGRAARASRPLSHGPRSIYLLELLLQPSELGLNVLKADDVASAAERVVKKCARLRDKGTKLRRCQCVKIGKKMKRHGLTELHRVVEPRSNVLNSLQIVRTRVRHRTVEAVTRRRLEQNVVVGSSAFRFAVCAPAKPDGDPYRSDRSPSLHPVPARTRRKAWNQDTRLPNVVSHQPLHVTSTILPEVASDYLEARDENRLS